MQNAYFSSTIYSFRTKASIFNDYSYLLNERFDRNPIHTSLISIPTSSCCDFCAPRVPLSPFYLYGWRQCSLLQSRRFVLGGSPHCYRVSLCGPASGCYEMSCERRGYGRGGKRGKGRCACVGGEEGESEVCDSGGHVDVEDVLSLLSEEVGEECFGRRRNAGLSKKVEEERMGRLGGGRSNVSSLKRVEEESRRSLSGSRRNVGLSKRVEEESHRSLGGSKRNAGLLKRVEEESRRSLSGSRRSNVSLTERVEEENRRTLRGSLSDSKRVEAERRSVVGREKGESSVKGGDKIESVSKGVQVDLEENDRSECSGGEKKSIGRYSSVVSDSRCRLESTRVELIEKDYRQKEERGMLLRAENYRGSSSSSYYSLSSGDYGNEADVQDKHGHLEEPGSSLYKDSHYDRGRYDGRVSEEYSNHRDDAEAYSEISRQKNTAVEGGAMWDWRKKSEKKLTEEMIEDTRASKKSSEMHSRVLKTNESELANASGSHKQFHDERENLYLTQGTKEQFSQTGNQDVVETESRRKFQDDKERLKVHRTDAEAKSQSQKRLSDREQNLAMATNVVQERRDEHYKQTGCITQREDLNIDIQKLTRVSEVEVVDIERTSNRRRQSDTRTNQGANTYIGVISPNQDSVTVSAATSVQGTMQRNNQTDKKLMQLKSRKEAQSSTKVSSFQEKDLEESSSFQASSSMVSQARMQLENVEGGRRSPQTPLLPPPPQLIARGSACVELPSGTATQEVSGEASVSDSALNYESSGGNSNTETPAKILYPNNPEDALGSAHQSDESSSQFVGEFFEKIRYGVSTSDSQTAQRVSGVDLVYGGEKYGQKTLTSSCSGTGSDETQGEASYHINPEDALGSAQRLEKSASQFVGEFSEKARHYASTSEEFGTETVSEAKWVPGGGKDGPRTSCQYGSGGSQLKGNESRHSSGGSGTKGPSVEMWDVTDTSTLESPEREQSEATTTSEKPEATTTSEKSEATTASEKLEATTTSGNTVAKRTGRSIWNVVADLVKLKWSSQAEPHRSAARLGERNSSTESASSEAWFSGRETEETSGKNVIQEKDMQAETTSGQLQPTKSFSQSEKASGSVKSKDKVRYLETGMTSSLDKDESRLTSQSVSLSSSEETLSPKDYQKNIRGVSSSIQTIESSQSQISSGIKSPVVDNQKNIRGSSGIQIVDSSQSQTGSGIESPLVKEISNAGYTESGSGSKENTNQFGRQKFDDKSDIVQTGGELLQRKLQRNKQVLKDSFDEWEEAQNLEIEQRKIDEMFMREALLEAKKAADTWEVPVGAVLVQQGKIIARGYNLVEELRDSTAHAEMICIREASNVLQTWRLAESTLYVTLEPCPMCAGAILQARVNTVVWGAPNKLLGADGSWIRLFPDRGRGSEPEQSDKPAAPVHPFHPKITIRRGVLPSECADTMQQFFYMRRRKKDKRKATPPAPPTTHAVSHYPRKFLHGLQDIFHIMFCL